MRKVSLFALALTLASSGVFAQGVAQKAKSNTQQAATTASVNTGAKTGTSAGTENYKGVVYNMETLKISDPKGKHVANMRRTATGEVERLPSGKPRAYPIVKKERKRVKPMQKTQRLTVRNFGKVGGYSSDFRNWRRESKDLNAAGAILRVRGGSHANNETLKKFGEIVMKEHQPMLLPPDCVFDYNTNSNQGIAKIMAEYNRGEPASPAEKMLQNLDSVEGPDRVMAFEQVNKALIYENRRDVREQKARMLRDALAIGVKCGKHAEKAFILRGNQLIPQTAENSGANAGTETGTPAGGLENTEALTLEDLNANDVPAGG